MASTLDITTWDGDARQSVSRFPVADIALPTGTAAKVDDLVSALTTASGSGVPLLQEAANLWQVNFITQQALVTDTLPTTVDNRNVWEWLFVPTVPADGTKIWKVRMGSRQPDSGNLLAGSKGWKVDPANPPFPALQLALSATGVNVKTPYNIAASSLLADAYALVSTRRTNPKTGGILPGQTGAVTFLEIVTQDGATPPNYAYTRIPITALALPTGYGAKITAVVDALVDTADAGTPLVRPNGVLKTAVKINAFQNAGAMPTVGVVENKWIVQATGDDYDTNPKIFSYSIGCRNPDYPLTSGQSNQIDTSNQNWIDFVAAIDAFSPLTDFNYDAAATIETAFAEEQKRKRPVA